MKRILSLVLLILMLVPQHLNASNDRAKKEILDLKQKISSDLSNNVLLNEKYYKHKIAQQQAKLIILTSTNFIYTYHRGSRNYKQIKEFVENAYVCSFIFPTLGETHLDVFLMYLRWAESETGYTPNQISVWKKGQQIKYTKMNKKGEANGEGIITIKFDSKDYGILQVNSHNVKTMKVSVKNLYKTGVIPFKVREIRKPEDLLDIKTNLVARSIIESDRKARGWEYKHYRYNSVDFFNKLKTEIYLMKRQDLYDINLVQKYYHLVPAKQYNS